MRCASGSQGRRMGCWHTLFASSACGTAGQAGGGGGRWHGVGDPPPPPPPRPSGIAHHRAWRNVRCRHHTVCHAVTAPAYLQVQVLYNQVGAGQALQGGKGRRQAWGAQAGEEHGTEERIHDAGRRCSCSRGSSVPTILLPLTTHLGAPRGDQVLHGCHLPRSFRHLGVRQRPRDLWSKAGRQTPTISAPTTSQGSWADKRCTLPGVIIRLVSRPRHTPCGKEWLRAGPPPRPPPPRRRRAPRPGRPPPRRRCCRLLGRRCS